MRAENDGNLSDGCLTGNNPLYGPQKVVQLGRCTPFGGDDCPTEIISSQDPTTPDVRLVCDRRSVAESSEDWMENGGLVGDDTGLDEVDDLAGE